MVYNIPGTYSYYSDVTGKTYATEKRAIAAENASLRMKERIPEAVMEEIPWTDIPKEIKDIDREMKVGSKTPLIAQTFNTVGWDIVNVRELLDEYDEYEKDVEGSPAWVLDTILKKNYPEYITALYEGKDGTKQWKIVERKPMEATPPSDSEVPDVKGTEHGLKMG